METIIPFQTPWWLRGKHLQTLWPALTAHKFTLTAERERLELPDGDFLDLDWVGNPSQPIILMLHGLCGSSQSSYITRLCELIVANNLCGVVMHFRGCSGQPNRLARCYHAGDTPDLQYVVDHIQQRFPSQLKFAVGFSLGGNLLLKWLGEIQPNFLQAAIAISVPYNLALTADYVNQGSSRFYQWHLLRELKNNLYKKFSIIDSPIDLEIIQKASNFWQYDDWVTAPLHGFTDVHDYYQQSSSIFYLDAIKIPTLLIHAQNDPLIPLAALPNPQTLPKHIQLILTKDGGHVGFCAKDSRFWMGQKILNYCKQFL
ncbi:MAG: hydrolase [Legionellales bacterium]|nr:hydrolase [Legionellales bacterium]